MKLIVRQASITHRTLNPLKRNVFSYKILKRNTLSPVKVVLGKTGQYWHWYWWYWDWLTNGTGIDRTGTGVDSTGTASDGTGDGTASTYPLALALRLTVLTVMSLVLMILALVLSILAVLVEWLTPIILNSIVYPQGLTSSQSDLKGCR